MPKLNEQQLRERAKMAAVESAPKNGVGEFLQLIEEDENVFTFLFRAKMKGYVGEACPECMNFTLVRNGTCMKCDTCGSTTGCS